MHFLESLSSFLPNVEGKKMVSILFLSLPKMVLFLSVSVCAEMMAAPYFRMSADPSAESHNLVGR